MAQAKILSLNQLLAKKYEFLEDLPEHIKASFGQLVNNFVMIVWGPSGNGKSSFLMQLVNVFALYGKVLYLGLEEGHSATMQNNAVRYLEEQCLGKISFADHTMTLEQLIKLLKKRQSPQFVIIDSVQYMSINYEQYKKLKEMFATKTFIFISHANGKLPDGKTADKIRYDSDVKVRVEGYIGHVISRFGGQKAYIIWKEGAIKYWGKSKFNQLTK